MARFKQPVDNYFHSLAVMLRGMSDRCRDELEDRHLRVGLRLETVAAMSSHSSVAKKLSAMELTRFRGYLTLLEGGCHDAQQHELTFLSTGLPATDDRTGTGGPQPGRPGTRV